MQTPSDKLATARDVVGLILSGAALLGVVYGYAKAVVKLNGLGGRLKKVEDAQTRQDTTMQTLRLDHERSANDRTRLHELVTEAKRAASEGHDSSITMRTDIIGAIHEMQQKLSSDLGQLRERVKGLEVQVEHLNRGHQ